MNLSLRIMHPRQINQEWIRSDLYHNSYLIRNDDGLEHAKVNSAENDLPEIAVSSAQGKLLNLYARSIGAKRILEVGTLGLLQLTDCPVSRSFYQLYYQVLDDLVGAGPPRGRRGRDLRIGRVACKGT